MLIKKLEIRDDNALLLFKGEAFLHLECHYVLEVMHLRMVGFILKPCIRILMAYKHIYKIYFLGNDFYNNKA